MKTPYTDHLIGRLKWTGTTPAEIYDGAGRPMPGKIAAAEIRLPAQTDPAEFQTKAANEIEELKANSERYEFLTINSLMVMPSLQGWAVFERELGARIGSHSLIPIGGFMHKKWFGTINEALDAAILRAKQKAVKE